MSGPSFEQGSPSPEHGMGGRLKVGSGIANAVAEMARTSARIVVGCIVDDLMELEASKRRR